MTLRDFIQQNLIEEIGTIKDEHPYMAFLLISCGIEFLGKCIGANDWQDSGHSTADFNNALSRFPSLQKYQSPNIGSKSLYRIIRCGLCHALLPQQGIVLSQDASQDLNSHPIVLKIDDFYGDFVTACETLKNDGSLLGLGKTLDMELLSISAGSSGATPPYTTTVRVP